MAKLTRKQSLFLLLFIVIIALIALFVFSSKGNPAPSAPELSFRTVPNEAFGFGERLNYKVMFGLVKAGDGYFEILPKPVKYNGRDCYDVRFQVNSTKSLEWVYKVKDNYRTVLDVSGIFPWHFEQHVREGGYKKDYTADFDQVGNYAITANKKVKVPPYVHDIVSAFFYVRTQNIGAMQKNEVMYMKNFFDDTTFSLGVRFKGRQTIEVDAGKFNCLVIEPIIVMGGLFKSEGNIFIWITDDDRKVPVKVSSKIIIGYVTAELVSYRGLRGPLNAKIP
jgi:hypothetical protein